MKLYEITNDATELDKYKTYIDVENTISNYRNKTEEIMKSHDPDYEIYKPYISDAYFPYIHLSDNLKKDMNIALFSISQNPHNFTAIPNELKTSQFITTAFRINPSIIQYMNAEEKQNVDVVRAVAKYHPDLFEYLNISTDKRLGFIAVEANPSIYRKLDKSIQNDNDILEIATKKSKYSNVNIDIFNSNKKYAIDKGIVDNEKFTPKSTYTGQPLVMDRKRK